MWFILVRNWNQVIQSDSILNVDKKWSKNHQGSIYWGPGEAPPPPPQKKSSSWKKIKSYFKYWCYLTTILRNQWRLLTSRNTISAYPEHYLFKIFRGSMPLSPLEGLKIFLVSTPLHPNKNPDHGGLICPDRVVAPQRSKKYWDKHFSVRMHRIIIVL